MCVYVCGLFELDGLEYSEVRAYILVCFMISVFQGTCGPIVSSEFVNIFHFGCFRSLKDAITIIRCFNI